MSACGISWCGPQDSACRPSAEGFAPDFGHSRRARAPCAFLGAFADIVCDSDTHGKGMDGYHCLSQRYLQSLWTLSYPSWKNEHCCLAAVEIVCAFKSPHFFPGDDIGIMAALNIQHAVAAPGGSASDSTKALGPPSIEAAIMDLSGRGLFAIPVRMFWDSSKGKKDATFPSQWGNIVDHETWNNKIDAALSEVSNANGVAILTGASRLLVIDVDNYSNPKKRSGMELWDRLIATHGEPSTLKAKSGLGGLHFYFRIDSLGLYRRRNFAGLKSGGTLFGIDCRAIGGIIFAHPACYTDADGKLCRYEWLNGPPSYEACSEIPEWLAQIINNGGNSGVDEIQSMATSAAPHTMLEACASTEFEVDFTNGDLNNQPSASNRPTNDRSLLLIKLSDLLKEKARDTTSTYASTVQHGLYGTYYCYRTHGPQRCYFGIEHSGSNNFNLLKRGRHVYCRCHGQECSHEPARKLGVLKNLKAALQDATAEPVDAYDNMQVITQYTKGSQEVQDLLLRNLVEHATPQGYANLGRLFGYLYQIEGRILVTTNESEKGWDPIFFVWSGTSWIQDTSNLVASVFTSQMGCLLAWYERQRERRLVALYGRRPELDGLVVDGVLKPLDLEEVNPMFMKKVKMAIEACKKELEESMPSFGKFNVQDVADVRKCLHSVVTELYVKGLLDLFDQDHAVANAPNGLIDLQTGALLPHHPQHLCNNQTAKYIFGASTRSTARFRSFLMEVLPSEAIEWLQMFLGYCLTGETSEELFVIANGLSGANGKGVLKQALRKAFGSYNCAGNKAIFIKPTFKANASAASSHLMQIRTNRFVTSDKSEGVEELHASFLKEASGEGELDARELFCKPQSYVPQFKLCPFTNYRPHFPSNDSALIRRLVLIMFNYTFKTPDELDADNPWHKPIDLSLKPYFELNDGAADTLDFCVRGATMYYAKKALAPTSKVLSPVPTEFSAAAKEYAGENDKVQVFLDEACIEGKDESVAKVDFVEAFTNFLYASGGDVRLAGNGLARAMRLKGYPQERGKAILIKTIDGKKRARGFFGYPFEDRRRVGKDG